MSYEHNDQHEAIVKAGGGNYMAGRGMGLVWFTSPATGSVLALAENELTVEAVRSKVSKSDESFADQSIWRKNVRQERA